MIHSFIAFSFWNNDDDNSQIVMTNNVSYWENDRYFFGNKKGKMIYYTYAKRDKFTWNEFKNYKEKKLHQMWQLHFIGNVFCDNEFSVNFHGDLNIFILDHFFIWKKGY